MFKFLHRKALENSIKDIEACIQQYPDWDYVRPMSDVMAETLQVLPKGLNQTPCSATRAYCVDLVRLANKSHGMGLINVWVALTAVNLYFSAWDMSYHNPRDNIASDIKNRARLIIDKFNDQQETSLHGHADFSYRSFEDWYKVFVYCAESVRTGLSPLIDYMDQEPFKRAYEDKIDPIIFGAEFGKDFDVTKFGK